MNSYLLVFFGKMINVNVVIINILKKRRKIMILLVVVEV